MKKKEMFSKYQLKVLKEIFSKNYFPDLRTKLDIALEFKVSVKKISIWFQNERQKFKKFYLKNRKQNKKFNILVDLAYNEYLERKKKIKTVLSDKTNKKI